MPCVVAWKAKDTAPLCECPGPRGPGRANDNLELRCCQASRVFLRYPSPRLVMSRACLCPEWILRVLLQFGNGVGLSVGEPMLEFGVMECSCCRALDDLGCTDQSGGRRLYRRAHAPAVVGRIGAGSRVSGRRSWARRLGRCHNIGCDRYCSDRGTAGGRRIAWHLRAGPIAVVPAAPLAALRFSAEARLLGHFRTDCSIIGCDHRIVMRKAPLLPVVIR